MMGIGEDSSISVNVIAWFDFASLHSITDQTHLLASPAPCVSLGLLLHPIANAVN